LHGIIVSRNKFAKGILKMATDEFEVGKAHSDDEIMANRRKVIDYLKNPELRKAKGKLRNAVGGRCCLGHMCDALGVEATNRHGNWYYGEERLVLPMDVADSLGMFENDGTNYNGSILWNGENYSSLAALNDDSTIKPHEIGTLLEAMIEGGPGTPFYKIDSKIDSKIDKE
jgi:hypothetical protein